MLDSGQKRMRMAGAARVGSRWYQLHKEVKLSWHHHGHIRCIGQGKGCSRCYLSWPMPTCAKHLAAAGGMVHPPAAPTSSAHLLTCLPHPTHSAHLLTHQSIWFFLQPPKVSFPASKLAVWNCPVSTQRRHSWQVGRGELAGMSWLGRLSRNII